MSHSAQGTELKQKMMV